MIARARRAGAAILALVRRDLSSGARRAEQLGARCAVIGLTGLIVVVSLSMPRSASDAAVPLLACVAFTCFVFTPALAARAFAAERESGALDLLLLSGVGTPSLALGRVVSSFLLLEMLLLDALPAAAALTYFQRPTLQQLALAAAHLTAANLALASLACCVSAWVRRPARAFAVATGALVAATYASFVILDRSTGSFPHPLSGLVHAAGDGLRKGAAWHAQAVLAGVLPAVLLAALTLLGLARQHRSPATARRPTRRSTSAPSGRQPLAWLLNRNAGLSRWPVQLALLGALFTIILVHDAWSPSRMSTEGMLALAALLASYAIALSTGAGQLAQLRDAKAWDSFIGLPRRGGALISDLLAGTLRAALPTFAIGALLVGFAHARTGQVAAAIAGAGTTTVLAALLGLSAALVTRSTGAALSLAFTLQFGLGLSASLFLSLSRQDTSTANAWLAGISVALAALLIGPGLLRRSAPAAISLAAGTVLVLLLLAWTATALLPDEAPLVLFWPYLQAGLEPGRTSESLLWVSCLLPLSVGGTLLVTLFTWPDHWLGRPK